MAGTSGGKVMCDFSDEGEIDDIGEQSYHGTDESESDSETSEDDSTSQPPTKRRRLTRPTPTDQATSSSTSASASAATPTEQGTRTDDLRVKLKARSVKGRNGHAWQTNPVSRPSARTPAHNIS